ncbi:hypothetical protein BZG36_02682 [Bifiguratus adelaidae]|uniref:Autophagy-related protein 9 n=1 Tax=Bifiguratus adelaidae TaxID=1938954 RepID=A0A261Y1K4_9FUNG|nr:hypothetical protein BZG36_02682 [Bifiguratus adelaidae]
MSPFGARRVYPLSPPAVQSSEEPSAGLLDNAEQPGEGGQAESGSERDSEGDVPQSLLFEQPLEAADDKTSPAAVASEVAKSNHISFRTTPILSSRPRSAYPGSQAPTQIPQYVRHLPSNNDRSSFDIYGLRRKAARPDNWRQASVFGAGLGIGTNGPYQGSDEGTLPAGPRDNIMSAFTSKPDNQHDIAQRAMWKWANVQNMDNFLGRVYSFYTGKGYWCILLARVLNLLSSLFVIVFSTFLFGCVHLQKIPHHPSLSDVIEPQCLSRMSGTMWLYLLAFGSWWIWQAFRFVLELPFLADMHNFYQYLLHIPDTEMQTTSWAHVVQRLIAIREQNPTLSTVSHPRLNAHDIANRIMRRDNYLIALFNKDILNLQVPVFGGPNSILPSFIREIVPGLGVKPVFTRDLEWNVGFCVLNYVFDDQGQVRKKFLRDRQRQDLVVGLRRRFVAMGLLNAVCAPFVLVYLVITYFLRYFEEYHKNPSSIGSRSYTLFAQWKLREFNELPHLFKRRLHATYDDGMAYLDQFPKEKTTMIARFVAFISGSFTAVLVLISVVDSELFNFEITPGRTVFLYITVFGSIFAVSRGMIPDERMVFDPTSTMLRVVEHTHYIPSHWRGNLHTEQVRQEYGQMFELKLTIFFTELLSVLFTPWILLFSLPQSSEAIIDFFREFTVHVDGVGYVCSFAVFDFRKHGNAKYGAPVEGVDDYWVSKEGKMEKSFLNFKANNPEWQPADPSGSLYLSRLHELVPNATRSDADDHNGLPRNSVVDSILQKSALPNFGVTAKRPVQRYNSGLDSNGNEFSIMAQPGARFIPRSMGHPSHLYTESDNGGSQYPLNGDQAGRHQGSANNSSDQENDPLYQDQSLDDHNEQNTTHFSGALDGSYGAGDLVVDTRKTDDEVEGDRNMGVYGLLNRVYELNNPGGVA